MAVRDSLNYQQTERSEVRETKNQTHNAMLVISVANPVFSTDLLTKAIPLLMSRHDKVTVFIADELMIYNRFKLPEGGGGVSRVLSQYRQDRERQLKKIIAKLDQIDRVRTGTYDDFCNGDYARIFRRLMLLALEDTAIMAELKRLAHAHFSQVDTPCLDPAATYPIVPSLLFLIDETAWTMNLAAYHGMTDNYYPGDVGMILKIFYCHGGTYDIFAALDIAPHVHRFWRLNVNGEELEPELMWQAGIQSLDNK